ncbi:MAG TPA: hypothetical protein VFY80_09235 [Burkholderiales bacterium]|jgi:hypothetical protein|nr:hypothetical protein [Burkholderiales bacterium]
MVDLAEGIKRVGFKRWYERQLIESHVYFVTAFLSLIVIVAGLEGYNAAAEGSTRLYMLALIAGGIVLCAWAFRRYQFMLGRAVRAAERSICSGCATYGTFEVVPQAQAVRALTVRCRKCGHEWRME